MSAGSFDRQRAWESLQEGMHTEATVSALLAISDELRTANLIAASGLYRDPPLDLTQFPPALAAEIAAEYGAIRSEIREELDLDDTEPPA